MGGFGSGGLRKGSPFITPNNVDQIIEQEVKPLEEKLEKLKARSRNMSDEERSTIIKEATRGSGGSVETLKPEYASLIIEMFLNAVLEDGKLTTKDLCIRANCSPVAYYQMLHGKHGQSIKNWMSEVTKTILISGVLPALMVAQGRAKKGSGKHLDTILDYLGLKDGKENKGGAVVIQFVDTFISQGDGKFRPQQASVKQITPQ